MMKHGRNLENGQVGSGSVNPVQRIGDTVVRPIGEWSSSIHDLLNHLDSADFAFYPKVIEIDRVHGREVLSYIDGDVAMRPWPSCLLSDEGIIAIGKMLREYHQSIRGYAPEVGSRWRDPGAKWQEGMIVRHGDLGPWNMVWKSDTLVGLIDWDLAEPGYGIEDIAQAAWNCVPIRPRKKCMETGVDVSEQALRLRAICEAYGEEIDTVIAAINSLQLKEIERTRELGKAQLEPWRSFLERGDTEEIEAERQWLRATYKTIAQQR